MQEREKFKNFWQTFKGIEELKETDYIEYIKQKEVLFIKNDMTKIQNTKYDYSGLIKYYKRKLVDYGAMKQIDSFKSEGKYSSKMKIKDFMDNKKSIV